MTLYSIQLSFITSF